MTSNVGKLTVKQIHAIHRSTNNFVGLMKLKLMENADKGLWDKESYEYLRSRVNDELIELDTKIASGEYLNARLECADAANFLMMISDNISYGKFEEFKKGR